MKNTNIRSKILVALTLLFALVMSLAIGALAPAHSASAATYSSSTIFSSGTGGKVESSEKDSEDKSYTQFNFSQNDGKVYFRRDLALKWFEKSGEKFLTLEFAFKQVNFKTFSLVFECAEENISKEGMSTNSVIFRQENGKVTVCVKDASETEQTAVEVDVTAGVKFTLAQGDNIGEFAVVVNGVAVGCLTNVGGNFLEYFSSASSTPRTPLTFVADELTENETLSVLLKNLNNQSFELNDEGKLTDNAAPVLVVNEEIYSYVLGKKWSLTYEAIDVCDTSVSVTREYVMYGNTDYKTLSTSTVFMPTSEKDEQYVSIRFLLTDDSNQTMGEDDEKYVYLTWYAAENAVETVEEKEYIRADRTSVGPYYIGVTANESTKTNDTSAASEEAKEEFQAAVTEAAEGLSAGDGAYFYIPSLRGLIASDNADYRNLTFNVYYHKQSKAEGASASSQTSLKYNNLKFEIDEKGQYLFCVIAKDASSNGMTYYVDGELVEVTANNVWDIDEIPKFMFEVGYTGATVEDAGEQKLGYRDSSYSVTDFEIIALDGYKTEYNLYYLNEEIIPQGERLSYSNLVKNIGEKFSSWNEKNYLDLINPYNDEVSEDDEAWERTDNDYHWNSSDLSFVPVKTGYYVVELTVTDGQMPGNVVNAYQVIEVRNPIDTPPDSSEWIENNIVSVVLFSISALLAIIIVILFVVKPAEKTVDEVDLAKLKKVEGRKQAVMKNVKKKEEEPSDEE